jgi:hypothetical protein
MALAPWYALIKRRGRMADAGGAPSDVKFLARLTDQEGQHDMVKGDETKSRSG